MIRWTGSSGSGMPARSAHTGNCPATTIPPNQSDPNPQQATRTNGPPGTRPSPSLGPVDGPDVRGLPDGTLLHLRDTYPIETAWAPKWVGDELRQVRLGAQEAHLAAIRAEAEARAAADRGDEQAAARQQILAVSYRAMHDAYRERETVFATTMADRADWEQATRQQRQLAVAADAELRRRHPDQRFAPLRSAEPEPTTQAQRDELTMTAGRRTGSGPLGQEPGGRAPRRSSTNLPNGRA